MTIELLARAAEAQDGFVRPAADVPVNDGDTRTGSTMTRAELRRRIKALVASLETDRNVAPPAERPEELFGMGAQDEPRSTRMPVVIYPDLARYLLRFNRKNRSIDRAAVEATARRLLDGQWTVVSQAVSFTSLGDIGNGQHRLIGSVVTGLPITVFVNFGLPAESIFAEDRGKKRTLVDDLELSGFSDDLNGTQTQFLAAAGRIIYHLDQGRVPWTGAPFPAKQDVTRALHRHPAVKEAVREFYHSARAAGLAASPACALFGLFIEADREKGLGFARRLVTADGLEAGTTLHTLHRIFTRPGSRKFLRTKADQMIVLVRGWNNWLRGRDVTTIQTALRDGKFPQIEGLKYDDAGRLAAPKAA